jgi:DNA (cytosine-5)-methyltransferase 1
MTDKPTNGSVCSGVGGADLGFENAGFETAWQVEIDDAANSVLEKRFPNAKRNIRDISLAGRHNLERVDVLSGGTPCQDFSVAGQRLSLDGDRSNLCLQFCRLADELDPKIIWWENVPGVLSTHDNAFGCFLAALVGADAPLLPPRTINRWKRNPEGIEYFSWPNAGVVVGPKRSAAWRVLDSEYFNVAQRRERVYVVADTLGGCSEEILFKCEMRPRHTPPSREKRERTSTEVEGGVDGGGVSELSSVSDMRVQNGGGDLPELRMRGGSPQAQREAVGFRQTEFGGYVEDGTASTCKQRDYKDATDLVAVAKPQAGDAVLETTMAVRRLLPVECERLQGLPDGWTEIGIIDGKEKPQSDSARYKQVGNGVTSTAAEWIAKRIYPYVLKTL